MNEPTNWCCFDSISINLSQLIVDFISLHTINLWLSVSEWKRKKEKVRFENHHQINQNQSINHKSTRNQSSKKWNEINLIFMSDLFPISNQSIKSTNHHWEWVICLFVWLFFVSIVSHLNWCLICFACWNQFNFPFIHSINQVWWWWWISIDCDNKQINQQSFSLSFACLFQFPSSSKYKSNQTSKRTITKHSKLSHSSQSIQCDNQSIKSKSNETNSFFLSLIYLIIIIESIKLFLSNSSIFNVSLLSINQSTNNQSNHPLLTHSQIKINSQINQLINQMNEWKQGCLFLWSALFVCLFRVICCLFVCLIQSW